MKSVFEFCLMALPPVVVMNLIYLSSVQRRPLTKNEIIVAASVVTFQIVMIGWISLRLINKP